SSSGSPPSDGAHQGDGLPRRRSVGGPKPSEPQANVSHVGDGMVQARGLRKSFGAFEAVRGIDVDVARGEVFGFLGPNGAGKSSTMRMIACVSPRTGGMLSVLGRDPGTDGP